MLVFLFLMIGVGCRHSFDFNTEMQKENGLFLTVHLSDQYTLDSAKTVFLPKDSKKIETLATWFYKNRNGWRSSVASWAAPDYFLSGKDFRLLVYSNGVVIGFTDENGKPCQYTKAASKAELNFLLHDQ